MESCIELGIRLFFELIKYLFAPQALIAGDFNLFLSVILRTAKWLILFIILKLIFKNNLASNCLIIGLLILMKMIPTLLISIPFVGWFLAGASMAALAGISAIAWGVMVLFNEEINPLIRIVSLPGAMLLGFINAFSPFAVVLDFGFAFAISLLATPTALISVGILLLLIFTPLSFLCDLFNKIIMLLESL